MANGVATPAAKVKSRFAVWLMRLLPPFVVVAALAIQFLDPQSRARIRNNAFDQLQVLAPAAYQQDLPIRVIAIDDASLVSVGQWPWSRTVMANVVDRLTAHGARVVAMDVVFADQDRTSPEQVAARLTGQKTLQTLLLKLPAHDAVLASSMSRTPMVLGFLVDAVSAGAAPPPAKARFLNFGGDARDWLPPYAGGLSSLPTLTGAAAGSGAVSLAPGNDGVLRSMPLLYRIGDALYPGFALDALRVFSGAENLSVNTLAAGTGQAPGQAPGIQGVSLTPLTFLPTAADGQVWLHFRHLSDKRYISAQDLLAGKVDPQLIKDHLVFIGVTAKGLGDNIYSPLGEYIPGIEGHVQLTEQLMTGEYLLRPAWENDLFTALMLGMLVLLSLLLARFRPVWSALVALLVVLAIFALSWWLFVSRHLLLDPFFPGLAVGVLFLSLVVPGYIRTESEQRWIRDAFARYVSPNRVKYLQAHPEALQLGAEFRECSFVMTDLEGFTTMMETYSPDQLADLLNEYLDQLIRIAFRHDGTIERIVGDAIGVMFSAPVTQDDHAARALACANEMDAFARTCARQQREKGIPFGRTRIGVNTGTVLVGNFGGGAMLDYRSLGDAINTAARLETINGHFNTHVCVSGATVEQCPDFIGRPVGQLVLKGKSRVTMAYEPLTAAEATEPRITEYQAAYRLLDADDATAGAVFHELLKKYPDDPLIAYHAQRLAHGETGSRIVLKNK